MFKDKVELQDFEKMDPEYQDLLKRVLTIQSDCEIGGPHLYVDTMLPTAPTKIDQLVVARTAAEEIDHYRKIARLAGDIGWPVGQTSQTPSGLHGRGHWMDQTSIRTDGCQIRAQYSRLLTGRGDFGQETQRPSTAGIQGRGRRQKQT